MSAAPSLARLRGNRDGWKWRKRDTRFGRSRGAIHGHAGEIAARVGGKKFERLGGNETLDMDARLMALTNTDLAKAVATGRFREDLFFRLNVLPITVPPLRKRKADIPELAKHFLARLGPVHGHADIAFDDEILKSLESYDWPGNVRELKNAVEHALVFAKGSRLGPADFPEIVLAGKPVDGDAGRLRSLEDIEREAIKKTLETTRYKIGKAAEILGISRKTLLEKRKKYELLE